MNKLSVAQRAQILAMLCEGSSMRSISRLADVSINTVSKLLVEPVGHAVELDGYCGDDGCRYTGQKARPLQETGNGLMPISEHPAMGTVVMCDFNLGFRVPEMVKRRPVVIISPKITGRPHLCTVVALSTDPPDVLMPYHCQIDLRPRLPDPWASDGIWVKGDMVNAVGFHRIDLIRLGKDRNGKRQYLYEPLSSENVKQIRSCVLRAMGMAVLTKHLP